MNTSTALDNEIQELKHKASQKYVENYIQEKYPTLYPELSYIKPANCPDQLWQRTEENRPTDWVFFSTTHTDQPQTQSPSQNRPTLTDILEEMLLSEHLSNQVLSLQLREAQETGRFITAYHLHLSLDQNDLSLLAIHQTAIDLSPPQPIKLPLIPDLQERPAFTTLQSDPESAPAPEPIAPLTPQQQLCALRQRATELSSSLAPSPHAPLVCTLNPDLPTTAQIIAQRDPYNRVVNLCLEYSPTITNSDLSEQLQRLGHYQHLDHLANQRRFIEDQMQDWLKLYGQPSPGAIARTLKDRITEQSRTLYHHLYTLAESCLDTRTALALQADLEQATTQQQHEKMLLDALAQNPIAGYLDTTLLERDTPLAAINPFTGTNYQDITLHAKSLKREGKEENSGVMLNHIAACESEAYQLYRERYPSLSSVHLAIRYTLTQKLYPNRSTFIGPATKAVTPRLELWWDGTVATAPTGFFTQIWQLFPALPTHPTQCLLITATRETQKLKAVALADGRIAQEGTKEYLWQALRRMTQDLDASTRALGTMVSEAVEQGRMRWIHLYQTEDLETEEPRDIVQLQFQLSELR